MRATGSRVVMSSRAVIRSRSSPAARAPKVSTRICSAGTPRTRMRSATASTSVVVFPVPGRPAPSTGRRNGPPPAPARGRRTGGGTDAAPRADEAVRRGHPPTPASALADPGVAAVQFMLRYHHTGADKFRADKFGADKFGADRNSVVSCSSAGCDDEPDAMMDAGRNEGALMPEAPDTSAEPTDDAAGAESHATPSDTECIRPDCIGRRRHSGRARRPAGVPSRCAGPQGRPELPRRVHLDGRHLGSGNNDTRKRQFRRKSGG